ncbi:MAG: hypothetical protein LC667_04290, partial [Thioalkalivibrio sp.]|nr:hypothetical protein [Thioalkalivibrio sp.]
MRIPKQLLGAVAALALASVPAAGQGSWLEAYPAAQDPVHAELRQMFIEEGMLASMLDPMNEAFRLPRDVTVEVA